MNRIVLVFALGLATTCIGCAAAVEDPQPEPLPAEPQRDPPARPFGARFDDPFDQLITGVDEYRVTLEIEPKPEPSDPYGGDHSR